MVPEFDNDLLTYDESDFKDDEKWHMLYEECKRKVERQAKFNNKIENEARKSERNIFIIFGMVLTVVSFTVPPIISGDIDLISTIDDRLVYLVISITAIGLPDSFGIFAMVVISIALGVYLAGFFSHLFAISLYFNMKVTKRSLEKSSVVMSSMNSFRLANMAHDAPSKENLKKCILFDYSDIIALNNSILSNKIFDKDAADTSRMIAFWNIFLFFVISYMSILTLNPILSVFSFLIIISDFFYRVAKVTGRIERGYAFDIAANIIERAQEYTYS